MSSEQNPPTEPRSANGRLVVGALFVGVLIGGVTMHFARPAEEPKVVVVQRDVQIPSESDPKPSLRPKPVTPVVDLHHVDIEPMPGPFKSLLKGPIEDLRSGRTEKPKEPAKEAHISPTPAMPIPNAAVVTTPSKPRKSPLDPIIATGLPEPPKPATLEDVSTTPIAERMADLAKFVREDLKGEAREVFEDGKAVGLQVTIESSNRSRLLSRAATDGGRRLSESRSGQAAVDAAEARIASLRQLRSELLQSLSPTSWPVVEAERDIAAAEVTLEEAQRAMESSKLIITFDLR